MLSFSKRYDAKADLWALGVLVYLMLYGKYPFHGPNTEAIVVRCIFLRWCST